MTFEEFKKTCFHTRSRLKIPLLRTSIEKSTLLDKKGHFDQAKADKILLEIYEDRKLQNK